LHPGDVGFHPEADLVGAPGAPPLTLVTVVVALGVALASTLVPAIRAARMSRVSALADEPRLPRRRESLIRLSRKLPVPALIGLRLVARRPRRAILSAASTAVTVMGLVAALAIHAGVDRKLAHLGNSGGLVNPDIPRAEQVLTVLTILLVTLAALTAVMVAALTSVPARIGLRRPVAEILQTEAA
jgi:putative ABC transport system permease protein